PETYTLSLHDALPISSAGTAVLDCPGGSTGTSRPLRFAARQGRSASGAGPSYGLPGQSRALPAWPAVRNLDGRKLAFSGQAAVEDRKSTRLNSSHSQI